MISWFFSLFREDSRSWALLHLSVKGVGLVLLSQSTSSSELSLLLVLLGMFPDTINHLCWTVYLRAVTAGQTPSYKYIGSGQKVSSQPVHGVDSLQLLACSHCFTHAQQQLSAEELAETSRLHTQKHLSLLKAQLQRDPALRHQMTDRLREGGKTEEVRLIDRFAEGTYPGVPYTVAEEPDAGRQRSILLYVVVVLVFAVLAAVFYDRSSGADL